jgi:enoyl-CoA hydratase/carnithine racemase
VVELVISDSSEPAKRLAQNPKVVDAFKPLFSGPSLAERGIVTVASVRSNVAAGGFAVATAADIVLCSESAVINPHYRGVGLYGSEFHTYSFYERAGEEKARELLRTMLPMSAAEACRLGLVDEVMKGGDADCYVERTKAYVRQLAGERADAISKYRSAPWTRSTSGEIHPTVPLTDLLISNKLATHATFTRPLVSYRHAELSQMLLDFYHQTRSKRFSERRRAFVRKIAPKGTPLRFATHRREDGKLDDEEKDEFDAAEGWAPGTGVEWSWVGLPAPPTDEAWANVHLESPSSESNLEHHTPELSAANSTVSLSEPTIEIEPQTPADTPMKPMSESVQAKLSPVNLGTKLTPAKSLSDNEVNVLRLETEPVPASTGKSISTRSRLFVPVRAIRRKSDVGLQRSPVDNSLTPPSPTGSSAGGLRRSRSSVEVGSSSSEQDLANRSRSTNTNRISRWFGSTFKSVKSPTTPRTFLPKTPEKTASSDKEEVLFPCYYDNNKAN